MASSGVEKKRLEQNLQKAEEEIDKMGKELTKLRLFAKEVCLIC